MKKTKRASKTASKSPCFRLYTLAFLIAAVVGFGTLMESSWVQAEWLLPALTILGVVTGISSMKIKDSSHFLIGIVALIVAAKTIPVLTLDRLGMPIGTFLSTFLGSFIMIVGTAAIVVALNLIYKWVK
tara:strand:+ start:1831 stop:2217 length:387 start_codon:yes stop_codon:yes gene_type:complete